MSADNSWPFGKLASPRKPTDPNSNLNETELTRIIIAVLVKRLGGNVLINQEALDDIAYTRLFEEGGPDGLTFTTITPERVG